MSEVVSEGTPQEAQQAVDQPAALLSSMTPEQRAERRRLIKKRAKLLARLRAAGDALVGTDEYGEVNIDALPESFLD